MELETIHTAYLNFQTSRFRDWSKTKVLKTMIFPLLLLLGSYQLTGQTMTKTKIPVSCDPITGLCKAPAIQGEKTEVEWTSNQEIIYIGDPMCSWCWGISPQLNALRRQGAKEGIPFRLVLGGLRPGGGDPWNDTFKDFLKHHWEEVNKASGQPFGYELFELEQFNYDTEPACRAVVTARELAPEKELDFYEHVQHYFYVKSQDPSTLEFYQPICEKLDLDYKKFSELFNSAEMKKATKADFVLNREWGIQGYPAVVLRNNDKLHMIANGYANVDQMWTNIQLILDN